jgi:hypothetical protein
VKINPNSDEGKRIKERRDAMLQATDRSAPAGSVREVTQIKDDHGEVIIQATTWRAPHERSE